MIKIAGLKKIYKSEVGEIVALDQVDLDISKGEIFGIIGLSGAGKSTLIRCLNLLEKPDSGKIKIDGKNIVELRGTALRKLRSSLGMIFQHFNLLMQRTVEANVAFPLEIAGVQKKEIKARVKELLELVGLSDKLNAYPSQLSGGQKQRVAIARALANNPKILLCDEATSALDPLNTKVILTLLKDINRKLGITIVLITHEMGVIKEVCDRVAVMDSNHIVESGKVIDIISMPHSDAARKLFTQYSPQILEELPISKSSMEYSKRVRVIFNNENAKKPIVSGIIRRFNIDINILFGNIDYIQDAAVGQLVLELTGSREAVYDALAYMESQKLILEVMK